MSNGIYLLQGDDQLIEMHEQPYDSESLLQELLARYPSLLAGDQMNTAEPRRWLLIAREVALPSEEEGADRWSIDHLFIDQDAIPTIVEVKRGSDTRIRREVIGQMLEYAANAVVYWSIDGLKARFKSTCALNNSDAEQSLTAFLSLDTDPEQFWQSVETNLKMGRIRLVFVADEIPAELRRIVEFLNEQMNRVEVLALEIRQYAGQGLRTLVPRVVALSPKAAQKTTGPGLLKKAWDEVTFFGALEARRGVEETQVAQDLLAWARSKALRIWWGKGKVDGSFYPMFDTNNGSYWTISVWTYGSIEIEFQYMLTKPPFDEEGKRVELRSRLIQIPAIDIPIQAITKRPSIRLAALVDRQARQRFIEILDWMLQQIIAIHNL